MVFEDIRLGGGLHLPRGLSKWIPVLTIHHDESIWGPDAHEFRLEQFATGRRSVFLPFASGPRSCVGQAYALVEAKVMLAMLLTHFRFTISDAYRHAPVNVLTLRPKPTLEELLRQLKAVDDLPNDWLCGQQTGTLSALTSPDDLFNFFDKLRGVLTTLEGASEDGVFLDPNSQLGVFLRCCILAFNSMTFKGMCHTLLNLVAYCNFTDASYDLGEDENYDTEMNSLMDTDIGTRAGIFDKYNQGYAAESHIDESPSALTHAPVSLHDFDGAGLQMVEVRLHDPK